MPSSIPGLVASAKASFGTTNHGPVALRHRSSILGLNRVRYLCRPVGKRLSAPQFRECKFLHHDFICLRRNNPALERSTPPSRIIVRAARAPWPPEAPALATVAFTPTISGALNSTLTITDNTSTGSSTLTLTGSGQ